MFLVGGCVASFVHHFSTMFTAHQFSAGNCWMNSVMMSRSVAVGHAAARWRIPTLKGKLASMPTKTSLRLWPRAFFGEMAYGLDDVVSGVA